MLRPEEIVQRVSLVLDAWRGLTLARGRLSLDVIAAEETIRGFGLDPDTGEVRQESDAELRARVVGGSGW